MNRTVNQTSGFTLVELLMTLSLLAILATLAIDRVNSSFDEARFEETIGRLKKIQTALIGDVSQISKGARTNFGYLGDVGGLPTLGQGIGAIFTNPGVPTPGWLMNSSVRIGFGWNGPYLKGDDAGADFQNDSWGTPFVYSPASVPPTIISRGSDRLPGGSGYARDITLEIPIAFTSCRAWGVIRQGGAVFVGAAEVELNRPDGAGVLVQTLTNVPSGAGTSGQFSISTIPSGVRSLTVYVPTKAAPTTATLGPIIFTCDRPNVMISTAATNI